MPFGRKPDAIGRAIDFDAVYERVFALAITDSGLLPVRADEEQAHGFIHKLMYERLLLSEYAIADLTILNANVYYELGIRHATRPSTTIMSMASGAMLPFDVQGLRALPYNLDNKGGLASPENDREALLARLKECMRKRLVDSPLYQLVDGLKAPPIDHERTDVFRQNAAISNGVKERLFKARSQNDIAQLDEISRELGSVELIEAGIAIDLLLSYRAVGAHKEMIDLVGRMDPALAATLMVQEQLAFALNREGRHDDAERILLDLIEKRGSSPETNGLLGRVYKDKWKKAKKTGNQAAARSLLRQAIKTYREGFEADWRDAYPGINALSLMEIADDPARKELLPVVRYALKRRAGNLNPGVYWDNATRLEIAILADDREEAFDALGDALESRHVENWNLESTLEQLEMLCEAKAERGENIDLLDTAMRELRAKLATR